MQSGAGRGLTDHSCVWQVRWHPGCRVGQAGGADWAPTPSHAGRIHSSGGAPPTGLGSCSSRVCPACAAPPPRNRSLRGESADLAGSGPAPDGGVWLSPPMIGSPRHRKLTLDSGPATRARWASWLVSNRGHPSTPGRSNDAGWTDKSYLRSPESINSELASDRMEDLLTRPQTMRRNFPNTVVRHGGQRA